MHEFNNDKNISIINFKATQYVKSNLNVKNYNWNINIINENLP